MSVRSPYQKDDEESSSAERDTLLSPSSSSKYDFGIDIDSNIGINNNKKQKVWVPAAAATIASVVTLGVMVSLSSYSSSSQSSSSSPSLSAKANRMEWDEMIFKMEETLYHQHTQKLQQEHQDLFESNLLLEEWLGKSNFHFHHGEYDDHEPLQELLYLNTTDAFDMLITSTHEHASMKKQSKAYSSSALDFYHYQLGWEAQINQAYCAVASSAAAMNSLRWKIDLPQDPIYEPYTYATQRELVDDNLCVRETLYNSDQMDHKFFGMGLDMTEQLLNCNLDGTGYVAKAYHVNPNDMTVDDIRSTLRDAILDDTQRVLVNYDRGSITQGHMGHGHFSPLGAYNANKDAFLIMDVAKYKYPPVWVPTSTLLTGISGIDTCAYFHYDALRSDMTYDETIKSLGCKEDYRGYIIIKEEEAE